MVRLSRLCLVFCAGSLLCAGCGSPANGNLAGVHGKVCYLGKPLPAGTVVFAPDAHRGGGGDLSQAEIQADGSYQLRCGEAVGAAIGWHRVTVAALADEPRALGTHMAARSLVPVRYRDPELSGLACEVKAGQDNTINFNLE